MAATNPTIGTNHYNKHDDDHDDDDHDDDDHDNEVADRALRERRTQTHAHGRPGAELHVVHQIPNVDRETVGGKVEQLEIGFPAPNVPHHGLHTYKHTYIHPYPQGHVDER